MIEKTNWERKQAETQAVESLEQVRKALLRAANEIEFYQSKLSLATTQKQKAEVVNWSINYLATGIYPNLRIDQLANAQADLQATSHH